MDKQDLQVLEDQYAQALDKWKIRVVARRASRFGLSAQDTEDLLQEIIPELAALKYDPAKANGKTEISIVTTLVDNRIKDALRKESSRQQMLDEFREHRGVAAMTEEDLPPVLQQEANYGDVAAVHEVLEALSGDEAKIADFLLRGWNPSDIADELNWNWHRVKRVIIKLRAKFEQMGFSEWEVV